MVYSSNETFGLNFFILIFFPEIKVYIGFYNYYVFGSIPLFWNRDLLYSKNDASYQGKLFYSVVKFK